MHDQLAVSELGPLQLHHQRDPLLVDVLQQVGQRIFELVNLLGNQEESPIQLQLELSDGLSLFLSRSIHLLLYVLERSHLISDQVTKLFSLLDLERQSSLHRLYVFLAFNDSCVLVLHLLLELVHQSLCLHLVFRQSYIDLPEMVLEVVVGRLEVHDEVLLLIGVELDVFDLFSVFLHDLLQVVERVFGQECELLNFCKVSVVLLIEILLLLQG